MRSKLFQNVHYSLGIKGSHPGGDCEGPARDLNLEKRDKYAESREQRQDEKEERR